MLKRTHKSFIFVLIFCFTVLNVVSFLHHYEEDFGKQKHSENSCIICFFVKYLSNLTFDVSAKIFYINIFFVLLLVQILKPKFNKTNPFLSRSPPL